MQSDAKRAPVVRLGAWLVLALALVPNISYMGHWTDMAGASHDHTASNTQAVDHSASDSQAHASHCHVGPAHCGGGESMIGTPFVGDDTEALVLPGLERKMDTERMRASLSGHATPILQPPQAG